MIDLKQLTVESIADSIKDVQEQGQLLNHKVILVTALGVVEGNYKYVDTTDVGVTETGDYDLANVLMARREIKISNALEDENDTEITQRTKVIVLEDVRLHAPGNKTFNLPLLTLFSDQIIGVTMGEMGNN